MSSSQPVSDPPRHVLHLPHGAVAYTDEGEGPIVVLIHGLPGSARDFRYLAPQIPETRVVRIEMPGFGGSARGQTRRWSIPARARLVLSLLDALEVPSAVVAGHSMGGTIATAVADAAPDRVGGLGLLASPGFSAHRSYVRSRVRLSARVLLLPGVPQLLRRPLKRAFTAAGFPRSIPHHELLATLFDASMLRFPEHAARLERVRCPTLVAWADDDRLVEPAIGEALAGRLPDGPRLNWATGGHNIQKAHAAELGAALQALAHRDG